MLRPTSLRARSIEHHYVVEFYLTATTNESTYTADEEKKQVKAAIVIIIQVYVLLLLCVYTKNARICINTCSCDIDSIIITAMKSDMDIAH